MGWLVGVVVAAGDDDGDDEEGDDNVVAILFAGVAAVAAAAVELADAPPPRLSRSVCPLRYRPRGTCCVPATRLQGRVGTSTSVGLSVPTLRGLSAPPSPPSVLCAPVVSPSIACLVVLRGACLPARLCGVDLPPLVSITHIPRTPSAAPLRSTCRPSSVGCRAMSPYRSWLVSLRLAIERIVALCRRLT